MTDWNRNGRIDASDMATEYAAYNDVMNKTIRPKAQRPTQPKPAATGSGAGAAWAIIAAVIIGILIAIAR